MPNITVNGERLLRRMDELASIGARPDGGVTRLAFSEADLKGRSYVELAMRDIGLEVRIDPLGNLFGIRKSSWEGLQNGKRRDVHDRGHPSHSDADSIQAAIMVGSHTDTVLTGGRYDGALGVLAALEAVERLIETAAIPDRTLIVASFMNEEGVRFMPDMMGSLFHRGDLSIEEVRSISDKAGCTIGSELDRWKLSGADHLDDLPIGAFLELHIEQGPVLETEGIEIGVVEAVQGLSWIEITVSGQSNHAGTTPMDLRRDAGALAGELMSYFRTLPDLLPDLRLTIGSIDVQPNLINVIPNQVKFTVDLRHPVSNGLAHAERLCMEAVEQLNQAAVSVRSLARVEPCPFSEEVVASIQRASDGLKLSSRKMISGAGHDAQILSPKYPSGMVFIPSKNGISHDVTEYSTPEDVVNGANVLLGAIIELHQGWTCG